MTLTDATLDKWASFAGPDRPGPAGNCATSQTPINSLPVPTVHFWEKVWQDLGRSFLATSQKKHPDRWQRFYETHGPRMRAMGGLDHNQGQLVVEALRRENQCLPHSSAVDLGCGTGWLALALAREKVRVLAVDTSAAMLQDLERRAGPREAGFLETRKVCWTRLEPERPFDLALAACFPPALCPEGIRRMESLGLRCALVVGAGEPDLPWVNGLWISLLGFYPFSGARHLQAALNFLLISGRRPGLRQITIPWQTDLCLKQTADFYVGYFSLFGRTGPTAQAAILDQLIPFSRQGRLQASGKARFGLLWWDRPNGGNS